MPWYQLEPYVAGGLGEKTVVDTSASPPRVLELHYEFEDWEGDAVVESTPCFLVTAGIGAVLREAGHTGFTLRDVEVSTTETFHQLHEDLTLPEFRWLDVTGDPGHDDFGLDERTVLVVSERAWEVLRPELPNCEVKKVKKVKGAKEGKKPGSG